MKKRMVVVLGNHDLHLLALGAGVSQARPKDADLEPILTASDGKKLLRWLRKRPVLHREGKHVMVHAGLHPGWSPKEAEGLARRIEARLRSAEGVELLRRSEPTDGETRRLWNALQAFINLRTCTAEGKPCQFKGPPKEAPPGCLPWFQIPTRQSRKATVIFGHWAALGRHVEPGVFALDSGAAWGGHLSILRLDDGEIFAEKV
jgi:bis(5'-nucleosyl)-tetraphosphatase (symmetrical)